jgi:hypothetical protein
MPAKSEFSFIRALRSAIKTGTLVDEDLIFSNEVERRIESTESLRSLRGSGLPAGARSFFCPVNIAHRAVTTAPGSGAGIVDKNYLQFSDLLSYSTAIQQGAQTINNAIGTAYLGMVSSLPNPSWVPETGPIGDTDPTFAGVVIAPKRISGKVIVSSMLLSMSPDAETLISADLGRSLSSQLDRAIYYGTGTNDQPLGIAAHPNTRKIPFDAVNWWQNLTELEHLCCLADVSEAFFGNVTSPTIRRELKRTVCGSGSTDLIWGQLTRPLSSNVINTNALFAGCWDNLLIISWALEVQANPFTFAEQGKVEITGHLFCNFSFRKPTAFGVIS